MLKNLILHPEIIQELLLNNEFYSQFELVEEKAKKEKIKIWISSASVLKSHMQFPDQIETDDVQKKLDLLLNNKSILSFLEKDLLFLINNGWKGYLNNVLDRLDDSAILVLTPKSNLSKQITVKDFFNKKFSPDFAFIDLTIQQDLIRKELEDTFYKILYGCRFILGKEIELLERKLADFAGTDFCLTLASGTDALLVSLMAYDVGPGDAIFTTPFTFIATAEVISLLGAVPIFVDIDEQTFNIDPIKLELAVDSLISKKIIPPYSPENINLKDITPKGILAVDLFGLPADYDKINEIARKYNLFVIEDGAQSFGAMYKGKMACSLADIGCTSFFPAKPLGAYGDGGAVFLNDESLFKKIQSLRVHGQGQNRYEHLRIGINGRFDTLQAAVILAKLKIFSKEIKLRQKAAEYYSKNLKSPLINTPVIPEAIDSVWAQYSILFKEPQLRDMIAKKLKSKNIPFNIYYPIPLHLQPAFRYLGYKENYFPISEECSKRIISLPLHPYITKDQQDLVIETILSAI